MSLQERGLLHEPVQPLSVYAKATGILDLYGQPAERLIRMQPKGPQGALRPGSSIPVGQMLITPVQIGDREYMLWLQRKDELSEYPNKRIDLKVYFQIPPTNLEKVEYDDAGYAIGYWSRVRNQAQQEHLQHDSVIPSHDRPKELDFRWFNAKSFIITPTSVDAEITAHVPQDITAPLGDGSNFVYGLLGQMRDTFRQPR